MNIRQKILLSLLLYIALSLPLFAQVVDIPDPKLRVAITEALGIAQTAPITQNALRNLGEINAPNKNINTLTGLEFATSLTWLHIAGNRITDLSPIANLTTLEHLLMWGNPISDIAPLVNLTNLKSLNAAGCRITDISPLVNLTQLTTLNLRTNRIVDVSPLANLTLLIDLQIYSNKIVDIAALANLDNLQSLEIQFNNIRDHSPLDKLSLNHLRYDQTCEMPPLPLKPRLENRTFPSIFTAWGGITWSSVINQPHLSGLEQMSQHDLYFCCLIFDQRFFDAGTHWEVRGDAHTAIQLRDDYLALNPNMIFLVTIFLREATENFFPINSPYWVRDPDGNLVPSGTPDYYLVNFAHPDVQQMIIEHALAVSRCGLYDGIMFDWWNDDGPILNYVGNAAEQDAKDNILSAIRHHTRPDFLIMGNTNRRKIQRTGPLMNGGFMETGVPGNATGDTLESKLAQVEQSLLWLENNLRAPRINSLEGWGIRSELPDSPTNLRWMRAITTLSLTHSNGYVLFTRGGGHKHYWYDFWDADLGRPLGPKAALYDDDIPGLYIREFTNGWAVYNHSGEAQVITLPDEAQGVANGLVNTEHALPNLDGEMYLKRTTDVNGNDIYIAEPINAVPGAALLLDASDNPGSIARWVNLGFAGGRLLASDRFPRVQEGEIEIPSIGFSGRRRYYTATASGQTFGGPIDTNPKLYLGDWTLEFLCKRNGNRFALEHQFAGFQNSPREGLQGIRLWLPKDGQELSMSIHADGFRQPERALNVFLEENVWTWVTIISINGESIVAYQDGVKVSRHPGVYFDANLPLDDISIGSFSYDERDRNFNGSFSIVRVYDRALSPDEVLQNIGATVIPTANPADVNDDGEVNILDLVAVASNLSQTGENDADVNGDGVVNILDLVQVAGAIGGGGAAPSASSLDLSMISAADVERWLALAQGLGAVDANFQRGIRFLQQLLALLTPKETTLLPNYPNPFNPETWIAYRLAREAEVTITIYDTKGTQVRRLTLGNQSAGHYAARGKAAYWDGRNEGGEAVASGIYFYQFRAGDYVASRRMVILK